MRLFRYANWMLPRAAPVISAACSEDGVARPRKSVGGMFQQREMDEHPQISSMRVGVSERANRHLRNQTNPHRLRSELGCIEHLDLGRVWCRRRALANWSQRYLKQTPMFGIRWILDPNRCEPFHPIRHPPRDCVDSRAVPPRGRRQLTEPVCRRIWTEARNSRWICATVLSGAALLLADDELPKRLSQQAPNHLFDCDIAGCDNVAALLDRNDVGSGPAFRQVRAAPRCFDASRDLAAKT